MKTNTTAAEPGASCNHVYSAYPEMVDGWLVTRCTQVGCNNCFIIMNAGDLWAVAEERIRAFDPNCIIEPLSKKRPPIDDKPQKETGNEFINKIIAALTEGDATKEIVVQKGQSVGHSVGLMPGVEGYIIDGMEYSPAQLICAAAFGKIPNWGHMYAKPTEEWEKKIDAILQAHPEGDERAWKYIMLLLMEMPYEDAFIITLDRWPNKLSAMEKEIAQTIKNNRQNTQP